MRESRKIKDVPEFRIPNFARWMMYAKDLLIISKCKKGTRCIWQIQTTFCHKQSTTNRELMFSSLSSYFQRKVFFYPFVVVNCLCETKEDWLFATIKAFGNPDKHGGVIQSTSRRFDLTFYPRLCSTLNSFIFFQCFKTWQNRKTSNGKKTVLESSRRLFSHFLRVALCKVNNRFTLGFKHYETRTHKKSTYSATK